MSDKFDVSVVVPTYRRPELLTRCLNALLNQVSPDHQYEIIVVSDGPDQAAREVINTIRRKDVSVKFIELAEKKGPAAARNAGWKAARGRLIAFTDDDCIPDINWVANMNHAYLRSGRSEVAFTGRTVVPTSDSPTDYEQNIKQLENAEFITANCALARIALERVGGLDEQFTMAWREDSDLQFRLLENKIPLIKVSGAVVTHPVRKVPWAVSIKDEKKGQFNALLYRKFPRLYKEKIQHRPPWLYYVICIAFLVFGTAAITSNTAVMMAALIVYAVATASLIIKRLRHTSKRLAHIAEMTVTSLIIPFLSLYYRFYGSIKYRVLMLP